jgi:NAD(P)H-dependent flavin oxidoreductase YrpB (nitropropane dioxygenase family)
LREDAVQYKAHQSPGHQEQACPLAPFQSNSADLLLPVVPIVQGGMQWVGYAELASAVSNAGGLGILTALTQPTPEDLRKEIRKCKTMTNSPFGVNITLLPNMNPPDYGAYAQVVIDEGIRIVETAGNSPGPVIKKLKAVGTIILHKCTTIRHAQSAINLGVDFLSIDGFECAGHVGETDITNFILLSRARQSLNVPFIASGGFADGQGLAAALSLGAEGINMGTRFMCTIEAPIHINIKKEIVKAQETDTQLVLRRWKNTSRLYKNQVTKQAVKIEQESSTGKFEEVAPYVSGKRGREVFINGDPEYGVSISVLIFSIFLLRSSRSGLLVKS